MAASRFDFVYAVVAQRDLVVTSQEDHFCRLEPRESDLAWHCDLDDGTPIDPERDPASFVRWVCRELRIAYPVAQPDIPFLEVRRAGPQSDLGRLIKGFGRLVGRASSRPPAGQEDRYVYTDPSGILDAALRRRIETWPSALYGDGVVRPAELTSIKRTGEGLVVSSASWWGSAPALDHEIGLALDVARRLAAPR